MIKKLYAGIAVLSAIMLSGCASTWVNPNKPATALYPDEFACKQEAMRVYPIVVVSQVNPGMETPGNTYCRRNDKGDTHCTTYPGMYMPPSYSQYDINASDRDEIVKSCLYARGWHLE
ncbi:hypothetical protein [Collimonas silvisoli]|uniref:hypothetical protein n=1 Tax=Collimonas silvisoli TaxID=2825884 RepID=UPI001B8B1CFD|nr:hypothetical protein [Collimonas silvisoli]